MMMEEKKIVSVDTNLEEMEEIVTPAPQGKTTCCIKN